MTFFYDCALFVLLFFSFPKFLWDFLIRGKYRKSWKARFFPKPPQGVQAPLIWLHAVSMGEVKALSTLVPHIRKRYPRAFIYVTTTTESGQKEAEKRISEANALGYLPLDFSWIIRKVVRDLKPSLLILVEGDYWFNLMRAVKSRGGKIGVVSGKLSEKSLQRYRMVSLFSRSLFRLIDHFCLQGEREKTRLLKLGIFPSQISITGNLKYDIPIESSTQAEPLKKWLNLKEKDRIITLGSTHEGEDKLLYTLLSPLFMQEPHLKILIVPRHPRRFQNRLWMTHPHVRFVDQMGILPTCYHLSHLVIIGGSFIPGIGGHDIFEPIKMGIPTLYGPYMEKQNALEQAIKKSGAARQVSPLQLVQIVKDILNDSHLYFEMVEKGKFFSSQMRGVSFCTWKELEKRISLESNLQF